MVGHAIILGLIVLIANIDWFIGKTNICRPIVLGLLVGIVMGDVRTGIIMGATLELAFIGAVAIGAAIPPETIVGTVLAVALSIASGHGVEAAVLLAVPISALALFVRLLNLGVISTLCLHRADKYAAEGNIRGVEAMQITGGLIKGTTSGIVTAAAYIAGSTAVQGFLDAIPAFVQKGLSIATGIMPAIGLALLAKLIFSRNVAAFFFLGFLFAAYMNISVTGMALIGLAVAVIMVTITRKQRSGALAGNEGGAKDDEF